MTYLYIAHSELTLSNSVFTQSKQGLLLSLYILVLWHLHVQITINLTDLFHVYIEGKLLPDRFL